MEKKVEKIIDFECIKGIIFIRIKNKNNLFSNTKSVIEVIENNSINKVVLNLYNNTYYNLVLMIIASLKLKKLRSKKTELIICNSSFMISKIIKYIDKLIIIKKDEFQALNHHLNNSILK